MSDQNPYAVVLTQKDDEETITGLNVGEHLRIVLDEDQYQAKQWGIKTFDNRHLRLVAAGRFEPDRIDQRFGERKFEFEITAPGQFSIEFEETQRIDSFFDADREAAPVEGAQTWRCTVHAR
jgi:hypothetical protein